MVHSSMQNHRASLDFLMVETFFDLSTEEFPIPRVSDLLEDEGVSSGFINKR